jgi:hypothetical protein
MKLHQGTKPHGVPDEPGAWAPAEEAEFTPRGLERAGPGPSGHASRHPRASVP